LFILSPGRRILVQFRELLIVGHTLLTFLDFESPDETQSPSEFKECPSLPLSFENAIKTVRRQLIFDMLSPRKIF
jgi:hypothetical protein